MTNHWLHSEAAAAQAKAEHAVLMEKDAALSGRIAEMTRELAVTNGSAGYTNQRRTRT